MLITNAIKIVGCAMMLFAVHPLLAYALVGLGAAAYSPAKYGILTELLPPQQLVVANGWIEGATVGSIILGVLLGGALITPRVSTVLLGFDMPVIDTGDRHAARGRDQRSSWPSTLIAAIINWFIPDTGVDHRVAQQEPALPDPRVLALRRAAVARPAGPDLARDDDAVLGRRRDAAVHRHRLGGAVAVARPVAGVDAAGRRRRRRRAGRGARREVRHAARLGQGAADRRGDGRGRDGDDLRQLRPAGGRPDDRDRRLRRILRRADERAAAAPRPRADGRRPLDRGAELQREHRHPRDGRALRADGARWGSRSTRR